MWFLYVLECVDGTLYTGISTDPEKRLIAHNSGRGSKYVRARAPAKLVAHWPMFTKSAALKAEAAFKKLTREQKCARISEGFL